MNDDQTTPSNSSENKNTTLSTLDVGATDQTMIAGDQASKQETPSQNQTLQVGESLGKYQIRGLLGTGAMGAVYLGFDPMIERDVAIKVLSPDVAKNPQALDRFLTEARSTGRLNHPNVVGIFDIDQRDGQYYIVMEMLGGGSLADRAGDGIGIDWQQACRMVAEAADGIAAAHEADLVHRDIKPENLMATEDGTVKVVDFGLSKLTDAANDTRDAATKAGTILGTPQYMSPEQCETAAVDFRSDIYSLGGTLFRLLTGRHPYQDSPSVLQVMMAHASRPVPDPLKYVPDVPAGCRDIIRRAMAKLPAERYQNAADMAQELRTLMAHSKVSEASSTPPRNTSPGSGLSSASASTSRTAASAVIVEPSKMQAMMLSKGLSDAGLTNVTVCGTQVEALEQLSSPPDIFITAMQLPDGQGDNLLPAARSKAGSQSLLILNSSKSDGEILSATEAPCGLITKRTKVEDVIRMMHAASQFEFDLPPSASKIDPIELSLLVICDSPQLPQVVAELIRSAGILDVRVSTFADLANSAPANIVFTIEETSHNAGMHLSVANEIPENFQHAVVAGVSVAERATLVSLCRRNMKFMTNCSLDADRLNRILNIASASPLS